MTPAPPVFEGFADIIAVLVLLAEFGMLRAAMLRAQVRLYAAQSLLLAVLAAVAAFERHVPELYALAVLSFALKVIIVPAVVQRLLRDAKTEIAGSGALGVASETLVALIVTAFGFFAVGALHIQSDFLPSTALSLSVAVALVAFVLMTVRRDVVSQAVGFFSLENGVSLTSLVVAANMPLILEVAFLFDLLVAVVVFGVLMKVHHERRRSLSTVHLTRLRG
jgi:hydrogenase-4 component E